MLFCVVLFVVGVFLFSSFVFFIFSLVFIVCSSESPVHAMEATRGMVPCKENRNLNPDPQRVRCHDNVDGNKVGMGLWSNVDPISINPSFIVSGFSGEVAIFGGAPTPLLINWG